MNKIDIITIILGMSTTVILTILIIADIIEKRKEINHENTCDCRHCIMDCCPHASVHSEEYKRAINEKRKR